MAKSQKKSQTQDLKTVIQNLTDIVDTVQYHGTLHSYEQVLPLLQDRETGVYRLQVHGVNTVQLQDIIWNGTDILRRGSQD